MPINALLKLNFSAEYDNPLAIVQTQLSTGSYRPRTSKVYDLKNGTGDNQLADLWTSDPLVFTSGEVKDLDLNGSTMKTALGGSFSLNNALVGIIIFAYPTNTTNLTVGGGNWSGMFGAPADLVILKPGGVLAAIAPKGTGLGAVTATTADILRITNGAGAQAKATVILCGR